jgi:hypothetical protein
MAFRLGGYQAGQERKLLNDALLYLQALEHGLVVLSGNLQDFDLLNQIVPEGRHIGDLETRGVSRPIVLFRRPSGRGRSSPAWCVQSDQVHCGAVPSFAAPRG